MVGACGVRSGAGDINDLLLDCREGGIVEEYILDNAVNNPDLARCPLLHHGFCHQILPSIKEVIGLCHGRTVATEERGVASSL
jgi:hypothetical protein